MLNTKGILTLPEHFMCQLHQSFLFLARRIKNVMRAHEVAYMYATATCTSFFLLVACRDGLLRVLCLHLAPWKDITQVQLLRHGVDHIRRPLQRVPRGVHHLRSDGRDSGGTAQERCSAGVSNVIRAPGDSASPVIYMY